MLGYWLGAMLTSVTLGLVIVFTLEGSAFEKAAKKSAHPTIALTLAGLLLIVVLVLATGRDKPFEDRRATRRESKEPPHWQRWMQKGDAKITFVIGVLLSFPGASYLVAVDKVSKLHYSTFATMLVVIGFCLAALVLLEIPLVVFRFASKQTPVAIAGAKAWGVIEDGEWASTEAGTAQRAGSGASRRCRACAQWSARPCPPNPSPHA